MRILTSLAAAAILLLPGPGVRAATVIFESAIERAMGQADLRADQSAPAGRLTVAATTTISGIGVLNYLPVATSLRFFIADAETGNLLYLSDGQAFAADAGTPGVATMTYKYSNPFAFTFQAGSTYALGGITASPSYSYTDFYNANATNIFSAEFGNLNAYGYADPMVDPTQGCCNVGFALLQNGLSQENGTPEVPEPATWAMMVLGFGTIGFAMRRRQRESASAA